MNPAKLWQRKCLAALSCASAVLLFAGCGSLGGAVGLPTAQVRFVQVSPGSPAMDLGLNGVGAAYGLGYETYTSYLPVNAGPATLRAARTGSGAELLSAHESFAAGHSYTVLLAHPLGSLQERIFNDQDTPATIGSIAIRLINAVEGPAAVEVYISAADRADAPALRTLSLPEGTASAYLELPAGGAYVIAAASGDGSVVKVPLKTMTLHASSGAVRTIAFAGVSRPGNRAVVGFTLDDADGE